MSTTTTTTHARRSSPTHLRLSLSNNNNNSSNSNSNNTSETCPPSSEPVNNAHVPPIPSLLSIPHSPPTSPLSPIDPRAQTPHFHPSTPARRINRALRNRSSDAKASSPANATSPAPAAASPAAPPTPLPWLWQCHLCARTQPLGVSRRCLEDGHYFCSGVHTCSTSPTSGGGASSRKRRRSRRMNRACASEFDYAGWTELGKLRRGAVAVAGAAAAPGAPRPSKHNCWAQCDYPSECRWGSQMNPAKGEAETPSSAGVDAAATSFEEILGLLSDADASASAAKDGELGLEDVDMGDVDADEGEDRMDVDGDAHVDEVDEEAEPSSGEETDSSSKSQWSSSSSSSSSSFSSRSSTPCTAPSAANPPPTYSGAAASPLHYPREYESDSGKRRGFLNAVGVAGRTKQLAGLFGI